MLARPCAGNVGDACQGGTVHPEDATIVQTEQFIADTAQVPDLSAGTGYAADFRPALSVPRCRPRSVYQAAVGAQVEIVALDSSRVTCAIMGMGIQIGKRGSQTDVGHTIVQACPQVAGGIKGDGQHSIVLQSIVFVEEAQLAGGAVHQHQPVVHGAQRDTIALPSNAEHLASTHKVLSTGDEGR